MNEKYILPIIVMLVSSFHLETSDRFADTDYHSNDSPNSNNKLSINDNSYDSDCSIDSQFSSDAFSFDIASKEEIFSSSLLTYKHTDNSQNLKKIKNYALEQSNGVTWTLDTIENQTNINDDSIHYIINARGDGNCGYRSFLGSLLLNTIEFKNQNVFPHLHKLLQEKHCHLFKKYSQEYTSLKSNVYELEIRNYLDAQIELFNRCKNINDVHRLLNQEYAFNYYMIMFLRYLIADQINKLDTNLINRMIHHTDIHMSDEESALFKNATENELMLADTIKNDKTTLEVYVKNILTWQDELTLDQTKLLAQATGITIYTINTTSAYQPLAISLADPKLSATETKHGFATILYVPGHYKVFIPISNDLERIIHSKKLNQLGDDKPDVNCASRLYKPFTKEQFLASIHIPTITGITIGASIAIASIIYLKYKK